MPIITIPKELAMKGELVVIPRKEYEDFLRFRLRNIKEVEMTPVQRKALGRARKNFAKGKFLTLYELQQKLGLED